MKILCVIDSLVSGGAQRQLVELALGFKEKGHEVSFLIYHNLNFFKPQLDEVGIPVALIDEKNYLLRMIKMRRHIRKSNPNSLIAFMAIPSFIATISGFPYRRWKLIVGERNGNPNIATNLKSKFYRFFHVFADYVVGNSNKTIELVKKSNPFIPSYKLKVIYNIVSVDDPGKFTINNSVTRIIIVSRYVPLKNLDWLIEALNLLPIEYLKKMLIEWYGYKYYFNQSISKINKEIYEDKLKPYLKLYSQTKNIKEKYKESDFVALFSHYEGFPNSISEAMFYSKPVIVTRVSDFPLLLSEGVNCFFCDSINPESIKVALMRAIDSTKDMRESMGLRNKIIADEIFSSDKIINKYLELLSS